MPRVARGGSRCLGVPQPRPGLSARLGGLPEAAPAPPTIPDTSNSVPIRCHLNFPKDLGTPTVPKGGHSREWKRPPVRGLDLELPTPVAAIASRGHMVTLFSTGSAQSRGWTRSCLGSAWVLFGEGYRYCVFLRTDEGVPQHFPRGAAAMRVWQLHPTLAKHP